jgi:hypothetical protein
MARLACAASRTASAAVCAARVLTDHPEYSQALSAGEGMRLARASVLLSSPTGRVADSTVRQVLERQPEIAVDLENHSVRSFQVPARHGNGYI